MKEISRRRTRLRASSVRSALILSATGSASPGRVLPFRGGHEKSSKNCHLRTIGCILALSWRPKRKCRFMTVRPRRYSYNSSSGGIKCHFVNNSSRQRARVA